MSRNAVFFLFAALMPVIALAEDTERTRYYYPTSSVFAVFHSNCPNGSSSINDPIYRDAGRLSDAVYCIFPAPDIAVPPGAACPSGFAVAGKDRCVDKRGRR